MAANEIPFTRQELLTVLGLLEYADVEKVDSFVFDISGDHVVGDDLDDLFEKLKSWAFPT